MPYEGNPDAESGPTQPGGGLASSWYPQSAVQASGTDYTPPPASPPPVTPARNFGRSSIFKGTDGHYYYQNSEGNWVDSGATDAVTAAQSIGTALAIGQGLAAYFVQQADVEAQQQGRAATQGKQYSLVGINDNGMVDLKAPDGSIVQKSVAEAGTLPGIAQSDLEQAQQEADYRKMRAATARFQMGPMQSPYNFSDPRALSTPAPATAPSPNPTPTPPAGTPQPMPGLPGAAPATAGADMPGATPGVGTSGTPNPYTGSTAGLTGQEAAQKSMGAPTMMGAAGAPPNGAAATMPGATQAPAAATMGTQGTGQTDQDVPGATTQGGAGSPDARPGAGMNYSSGVPASAPGTSWSYGNDGTVQGFENGNQLGTDWLTRQHNTYMLGGADYTNGMNRSGWEDWYRDQTNKKNLAAMGRTNDIQFNGDGTYTGTDWMGEHVANNTGDALMGSGSATATELERARAAWMQWKTNQNMQNLAATSRNLSGMGFSAIGAPRIAGYG